MKQFFIFFIKYFIKSGGPYKSGGLLWSAGFHEEKIKICRTNSMVYTIVSTRLVVTVSLKARLHGGISHGTSFGISHGTQ
jgi:hypothetical protein